MKRGKDTQLTFSAVICTRNRPLPLQRCVASLLQQSQVPEEIIIVDDASTEPVTAESLLFSQPEDSRRKLATEIIIASHTRVQGITASRNLGIALSSKDIIAFMDDDSYADRNWISQLASNYSKKSIIGAGGPYIEVGREVPVKKGVKRIAMITRNGEFVRHHRVSAIEELVHLPRQTVRFLQGGNMSFRQDTLHAIGGLDTGFKGNAYGEEMDLCLRAGKRGRIVFDPKAFTYHHSCMSGGNREHADNDASTFLYWFFRNRAIFFLKHFSLGKTIHMLNCQFWKHIRYVAKYRTMPTRKYITSTSLLKDLLSSFQGLARGIFQGSMKRDERLRVKKSTVQTYTVTKSRRNCLHFSETTPLFTRAMNFFTQVLP